MLIPGANLSVGINPLCNNFISSVYELLPAIRTTVWQPGVTYNGGIPNRTVIYTTLNPSGGDDTTAIQNALDSCPANQVVMLGAGTFNINDPGLAITNSNITLRGSGPNNT